ncbi:adenosine deaminase family protein [Streptomyces purpureus]|uniref:adenosine deaminase n=1 Tax=Streptomyces purpureus TaxID=1951 RepID=A0A918HE15_9ACTN|nr:adenosine deaminase [Streptomyces purpureus]GGT54001.1 adenosine deaminase [Streptomyces purpureus]
MKRAVKRAARKRSAAVLAALTVLCLLPATPPSAARTPGPDVTRPLPTTAAERRTDDRLHALVGDPVRRGAFFRALPKGGDLHNHLAGAVRTETLIGFAVEAGLCVDEATMTAVAPPCGPGRRPAVDTTTDPAFRDALVRAWSMEDFPPGQSGHDHFFATFGKFALATRGNRGRMLADVAGTLARHNQFYLETMDGFAVAGAAALAAGTGYDPDLDRMHRALLADGRMDRLVAQARRETDAAEAQFRTSARCDTPAPDPGCSLTVRWIPHVLRESTPQHVFTQMVLAMRLAERDPRHVAVNLLQPEDGPIALRDYRLHMRMLAHLRGLYPRAHVTLHAGELVPGLVKPEHLTFHIGDAVRTARAERIGHGVDLRHEDGTRQLLRTMARREVAVETPLTSNAQILGVFGAEHPFMTYRRHGVPVVLATDDPGVSRITISHEYERAALTYGLSYPELKDLARASLEYAFLPGRSLWSGNPTRDGYRPDGPCRAERPGTSRPGPSCAAFLAGSPKAAVQWRQEAAFTVFEAREGR